VASSASPVDPVEPAAPLRVGIVGAARTRQGLGPFLASAFEAAGARVTAVAGRDRASGQRASALLAVSLRHPVDAAADAHELARAVDLLVVAAPVGGHLAGLDAALAAGIPCLCEKPLVAAVDVAAGLQRIAAFRDRGLLLAENCQWPFVLPALHELHPATRSTPVHSVAMGLGPSGTGPAMVADSLSHVLSVVQALVGLPRDVVPANVRQTDASADARANVVQFDLRGPADAIAVSLHLVHTPEPPRPAWLAVNGARIDRSIGPGYSIAFATPDGRMRNVQDPLYGLVYGLVATLPHAPRERTTTSADVLALRLRLYAAVLAALGAGR
jgi:predicted dehydrogenase